DELLVRRVIHRGGKSRTYINGALTTAGRLAELGRWLVDLSGQHQHQGLVDPRRHRDILDQLGGHDQLLAEVAAAPGRLGALIEEHERLAANDAEREQRVDFLRFQLAELDAANLEPGEDEKLEGERLRLRESDRLMEAARTAEEQLYSGDGSAADRLGAA